MTQAATQKRPLLILGMHRSGTSCLAGCLEEAGLFLGEVNRAAQANRKGNRENLAVMAFNDRVLARVGAAWDRPPAGAVDFTQQEVAQLRDLIATYPTGAVWGLKDPRLLLLFEAWDREIGPRLVGTFRHPAEVAASLMVRAEAWGRPMSEMEAFALWRIYNERMLEIHQARPFPLLRFDQDPAAYQATIPRIAHMLDLPGNVPQSFFDKDLRIQRRESTPIPASLNALWDALLSRAM
jgi:hypothetical protein